MSRGSALLVIVWIGCLVVATGTRSRLWRTSNTIWADAYAKSPDKPRVLVNYGELREVAGDPAATALYARAYRATQTRPDQRSLLSKTYVLQDLIRRLNTERRMDDLWTVLITSGCRPTLPTLTDKRLKWSCVTKGW